MKKFDYKMLTVSVAHLKQESFRSELGAKFSAYGSEGWEMIKMEPIHHSGFFSHASDTNDFLVVFKKEIN